MIDITPDVTRAVRSQGSAHAAARDVVPVGDVAATPAVRPSFRGFGLDGLARLQAAQVSRDPRGADS